MTPQYDSTENTAAEAETDNASDVQSDTETTTEQNNKKKPMRSRRLMKWSILVVTALLLTVFLVMLFSDDPRLTGNSDTAEQSLPQGSDDGTSTEMHDREADLAEQPQGDGREHVESGGAESADIGIPGPIPPPVPPPGDDDIYGDATADDDERYVISTATATIGIELDDMEHSVRSAEDIVIDDYDGHVESREERYSPYEGDIVTTRLTFRVPSENHASVLAELSELGEVEQITENSDDVTGTIVELDTRIENAESSLERLREFMDEAESIDDLLSVERQLEQRQANLEVMMTQRERLGDQAEMSTLNIVFEAEVDEESATEDESFEVIEFEPNAFTDGLERGWSAIVVIANTLIVGAGLVLPWSPLLIIIGILVWIAFKKKKKKS